MAEENNKYTPPALVSGTASFGSAFAITESAIDAHNIQALPDRPNATTAYGGSSYSAKDLKERFEGLARLAINAINTLINELGSNTVSSNIKIPEWGGTGENSNTLQALVNAVQNGKLAEAIKVDSNDSGESDNEYDTTLQAVLTTLLTKAKSLKTDIADGTLADNLKVDTYNEASTLQAVLTVLTSFVTKFNTDISSGDLANKLKVNHEEAADKNKDSATSLQEALDYLFTFVKELKSDVSKGGFAEKLMLVNTVDNNKLIDLQSVANGLILDNKGLVSGLNNAIKDIDALKDKVGNAVGVYRPRGTAKELPLVSEKVGDVWNIEPTDGGSFEYDGKKYPFGTNMVYLGDGKWDALGGITNYRDITQWDYILTSPDDLNYLGVYHGNVLLDITGVDFVYPDGATFNVSGNITLLDFGFSDMSYLTFEGNSSTTVRNCRGMSVNFTGFGSVENCTELVKVTNCNSVRDCDLREAVNCANMQNCYVQLDYLGTIISYCKNISDLIVRAREQSGEDFGAIEFSNCDHITNVHCESEYANQIHYNDCEFVDPYTCAGYVQPENSGKVPVPDSSGGVQFKEYLVNEKTEKYPEVYALQSSGVPKRFPCTESLGKHYIALRSANGQLNAPNQDTYEPSDDQFISKRYSDSKFMPKQSNSTSYFKLIGVGTDGNYYQKSASSAVVGNDFVPLRTSTGQLAAPKYDPTKTNTVPGEDEYISRRYFEANAPSGGGSKLYRHDITFEQVRYGGNSVYIYLTFYTAQESAYTSFADLPLSIGEQYPASGCRDQYDRAMDMSVIVSMRYDAEDDIMFRAVNCGESGSLDWFSFNPNAQDVDDVWFYDAVTEVI